MSASIHVPDSTPLLPCPFCGGRNNQLQKTFVGSDPRVPAPPDLVLSGGSIPLGGYTPPDPDSESWRYFVTCGSCGATGPWWKQPKNATRWWNTRDHR